MQPEFSLGFAPPAPPPIAAPPKAPKRSLVYNPKEFKVVSLRECPLAAELQLCDVPDKAVAYWREHIVTHPYFNPDAECFAVLFLNTRRRVKGHHLVTIGTLDTVHTHPRESFRAAIVMAAQAVIFMHNHPSGDSTPSDADIKVTRDFIRAGQLLKIEVIDHIIVGEAAPPRLKDYTSLRELGHFYST